MLGSFLFSRIITPEGILKKTKWTLCMSVHPVWQCVILDKLMPAQSMPEGIYPLKTAARIEAFVPGTFVPPIE
jgi:hypothetical protein